MIKLLYPIVIIFFSVAMVFGGVTFYKSNKLFSKVRKTEKLFLDKNTDCYSFILSTKAQFDSLVFKGKYGDIKEDAIKKECDKLRLLYFLGIPLYTITFVLFVLAFVFAV